MNSAVELPPDSLQGDALVEWLITRNEESLTRFARMSCDVRISSANENGAAPRNRLESWLIDDSSRKVIYKDVQAPTMMPDGRKFMMDHRNIMIITPKQFIECNPDNFHTRIFRPDADGYFSKATYGHFYTADHPLQVLSGGPSSERLRTQYENPERTARWSAARVVLPSGRIVYNLTTTGSFPGRETINQRQLDPEQGYLMTSYEVRDNQVVVGSLRTESANIDGMTVPIRITRVSQLNGKRITTIELANVRMNPEISPKEFSFDSLPLPQLVMYSISNHGQERTQTVLRDGEDHLTEDSPRYNVAMQRWIKTQTDKQPPAGAR